ncbi:MAG TPA: LysM peptidoglycan-binding domain-containing protein [Anaerolineae bacterium]|nr:LysM peptidoglycan-binding domain-containing protein [Anaerolineae bacterium]HNU04348.1 LysM peptidoglycan-binding domain-containing protein [Anaerolineae bacterium]
MNRSTRRLALVLLLLLIVLASVACQRERPAAQQEGWTTPAAGTTASPAAMDAVSPAVTAVTAGTTLPTPGGFITGTLPTPAPAVTGATATPGAAMTQVGATYGYVVKADDTLFSIALLNNTDVETIRRLNNLPDDTIQVGQVLMVPGTGEPAAQPGADGATPAAQAAAETVVHVVGAGENLSSIAVQYDVEWQEIANANNIPAPYTIYRGQRLVIPGVSPTPQPTAEVRKHVVLAGETLLAIAQQYNTTTQAIMAANNLSDPNFLRVGQELIIPE